MKSSIIAAAAAAAVTAIVSPSLGQLIGPSTAQTPYVVPVAPGVITKSLISNGDGTALYNGAPVLDETYPLLGGAPGSTYRLAGIPDGLGAFDNADGTFTLLVNHELGATSGNVRAHGATGAFVSRWVLDRTTLSVLGGNDLITSYQADPANNASTAVTNFARFCSADLPLQSALQFGGLGTPERIYFNGEETGAEGRGVATVISSGRAYNLPHTGKFSWENNVPSPFGQAKTVVAGLDDSGDGQVYFYVGEKKATGTGVNPVDDAGLVGGNLYGLRVPSLNNNSNGGTTNRESAAVTAAQIDGRFEMHNFGDVSGLTGAQLESLSDSNQVTQFARTEDGAWSPKNPNEFFFVTTDTSRLFRATFDDITRPELGGRIDVLVDLGETDPLTGETVQADDNITVVIGRDGRTRVLIQEDGGTGPDDVWMYTVETDSLLKVATHDVAYSFANSSESSGIIPAWDLLGDGWFLLDTQAAYAIGSNGLVRGGQVMAMYVPQSIPEPGALALAAGGLALALRRRR